MKLSNGKTELVVVVSKKQRSKVNIAQIRVCDSVITPTDSVTNLGYIVDENLSWINTPQVSKPVCVSLRNTGLIRKHIIYKVSLLLLYHLLLYLSIKFV